MTFGKTQTLAYENGLISGDPKMRWIEILDPAVSELNVQLLCEIKEIDASETSVGIWRAYGTWVRPLQWIHVDSITIYGGTNESQKLVSECDDFICDSVDGAVSEL